MNIEETKELYKKVFPHHNNLAFYGDLDWENIRKEMDAVIFADTEKDAARAIEDYDIEIDEHCCRHAFKAREEKKIEIVKQIRSVYSRMQAGYRKDHSEECIANRCAECTGYVFGESGNVCWCKCHGLEYDT